MKPAISIKNIYKDFGSLEVLKNISFDFQKGKVYVIVGPSGSGKTTFLRCINMLTSITAGEIKFDNFSIKASQNSIDVRSLREKVVMVFQQFNLWPHKTVLENIILAPMIVKHISKQVIETRTRLLLKRVGLEDKINQYPNNLSGGQQQRVAIVRALAMEPQILLFDEVTSALDPELVGEVLDTIKEIAIDHDRTIIIVTHEMAFAREVADQVIFMDKGVIVESGVPGVIFNEPKEQRTKQFFKRVVKY